MKGGNGNKNGPAALPAELTKNDRKLLTKAKAEQEQNRTAKAGGQQQAATMPVVSPTTEEAPRRTRSERRKAAKEAAALAGASDVQENALPAEGKGDGGGKGKGKKGEGGKGGKHAASQTGGQQRTDSQARGYTPRPDPHQPKTNTEHEKAFLDVWQRKGKHTKYGESGVCMWFRIHGSCIHGEDCKFSHDPTVIITAKERELCKLEMKERYEWNSGKQPGGNGGGGTPRKGNGKANVVKASDGKEQCRAWLRGTCSRGDTCNWAHYH